MAITTDPVILSIGAALVVAIAHGVAHMRLGDDDAMNQMVGRSGIVVMLATGVVVFALLTSDTLLSGEGFLTSQALAAGLVVFMLAVLLMNKGRMWFINILAQKEPLMLAIGVVIILLFNNPVAMLVGLVLFVVGFASRYTDAIDI